MISQFVQLSYFTHTHGIAYGRRTTLFYMDYHVMVVLVVRPDRFPQLVSFLVVNRMVGFRFTARTAWLRLHTSRTPTTPPHLPTLHTHTRTPLHIGLVWFWFGSLDGYKLIAHVRACWIVWLRAACFSCRRTANLSARRATLPHNTSPRTPATRSCYHTYRLPAPRATTAYCRHLLFALLCRTSCLFHRCNATS